MMNDLIIVAALVAALVAIWFADNARRAAVKWDCVDHVRYQHAVRRIGILQNAARLLALFALVWSMPHT